MLRGTDVALYLIRLDSSNELFNKKRCVQNGRTFYEGNIRLNHYMHLAQNIYIAKYGKMLMDSVFYACDDGAVDMVVYENYSELLERRGNEIQIGDNEKKYLNVIYQVFRNASLEELTEVAHEDPEWISKYRLGKNEKMDPVAHEAEYREIYADMIKVMENMDVAVAEYEN